MSRPILKAIKDWCVGKFQLKGDYALKSELPARVGQLENDSGFLTEIPETYAAKSDIPTGLNELENNMNFKGIVFMTEEPETIENDQIVMVYEQV